MSYKLTYTVKEQYERKRQIIVQNIVPCFLKGKDSKGFTFYQGIHHKQEGIRIVVFCQSIEGLTIFTDIISFEMANEKIVQFVENHTNNLETITSTYFFNCFDEVLERNRLKRH